jgi:hypothetical protein
MKHLIGLALKNCLRSTGLKVRQIDRVEGATRTFLAFFSEKSATIGDPDKPATYRSLGFYQLDSAILSAGNTLSSAFDVCLMARVQRVHAPHSEPARDPIDIPRRAR